MTISEQSLNVHDKVTLMEIGVLKAYINSLQAQIRDLHVTKNHLEKKNLTRESRELGKELHTELEEYKRKLEVRKQQIYGSLLNG